MNRSRYLAVYLRPGTKPASDHQAAGRRKEPMILVDASIWVSQTETDLFSRKPQRSTGRAGAEAIRSAHPPIA